MECTALKILCSIAFACFMQFCTANINKNQHGMISVADMKELLSEELDTRHKSEIKHRDKTYQQHIENFRNEMLSDRKKFERQMQWYQQAFENQQQKLNERIEEIESQNVILRNEINLLRNARNGCDRCCGTVTQTNDDTDDGEATSEMTQQTHYPVKGRKRQVQNTTKIAFYACLNNGTNHLGNNQDIVFDSAILNMGNSYNAHHGTFVAPVHGVYVFSATLARSGSQSWAHFMKNGQMIGKFDFADPWAVSSQTNVVELKKGDDVSVQNEVLDRGYRGDCFSSFAGFLLYEIVDQVEIVGR